MKFLLKRLWLHPQSIIHILGHMIIISSAVSIQRAVFSPLSAFFPHVSFLFYTFLMQHCVGIGTRDRWSALVFISAPAGSPLLPTNYFVHCSYIFGDFYRIECSCKGMTTRQVR